MTMDMRDIEMAIRNADPETKAAVGALLGLGAGGAVGGAIGGWKGAGVGAGAAAPLGAVAGLAIPESGGWDKLKYFGEQRRPAINKARSMGIGSMLGGPVGGLALSGHPMAAGALTGAGAATIGLLSAFPKIRALIAVSGKT